MSIRPSRHRLSKLPTLWAFDQHMLAEDIESTYLIGVDEVGRGSLVGPVVAAAFCFPFATMSEENTLLLADLDDSKAAHLSHEKRLRLSQTLRSIGYWGIAEASQHEIETLNISKASLLACYRAIETLLSDFSQISLPQCLVIMDGRQTIPGVKTKQIAVVKADAQSASVAAASILAKAYRDSMMIALAHSYPQYGWEQNAGYPTPSHLTALSRYGVTVHHRSTYKSVQNTQQLSLVRHHEASTLF